MSKKSRRKVFSLMMGIVMIVCCFTHLPALAQDAGGLISEVNNLRVTHGLTPYIADSGLSALAQAQSEYQASIGRVTHDRADGSAIPARSENVCGGINMSSATCVKSMWTDPLHLYTLIGLDSGSVGGGVATAADGSVYYTLLVNSSGKDTNLNNQPAANASNPVVAANQNAESSFIDVMAAPVQPGTFATSTPELDGSVYHVIQPNETLWTIAVNYGTTVEQIQAFNNMAADDVSVRAGQKILIRYGGTPVADTLTPTATRPPSTNTPHPTSTITITVPPLATQTPTITPTRTPGPLIKHISFFDKPEARTFGLVLTIICGIGLVLTLILGFFRR